MPRPTKFDLMRANRYAAEVRIACAESEAVTANVHAFIAESRAPAVPVMEVDGVLYREAPRIAAGINECKGCEFVGDGQRCCDADEFAVRAFGGLCYDRDVIYLRAE